MNDLASVLAPKSDQINAQDLIGGDMVVTIVGVKITPGTEQPVAIRIEGTEKVWRPCKTTGRILMAAWGADTAKYVGRSAHLYLDPTVKWGGLAVGGIRIKALSHIDAELRLAVAESKQVRKVVSIKPLVIAAPASKAADDAVMAEARAIAATGTDAFKAWFKANPAKRPECTGIMPELQKTCADADAAVNDDPFGLPPLAPAQSTDADISAQIAAEIAARDRELEGQP